MNIKAEVIKEFAGRPDKAAVAKVFSPGDMIEGDLAAVAVANGWAKQLAEQSKTKRGRNK